MDVRVIKEVSEESKSDAYTLKEASQTDTFKQSTGKFESTEGQAKTGGDGGSAQLVIALT